MIASPMLLIAAMSMVSCAKRINLKPESGDVIHPMAAPILHEVRMTNTPVVTVDRLRPQSSIFPSSDSNLTEGLFPSLAGMTANSSETRVNWDQLDYSADLAGSPRAVTVVKDVVDTASSPKEPSTAIDSAVTNTAVDAVIKDVKVAASLLKEPAIDTVESLKLDYFKGPWFQVYGSRSPTNLAFGNDALSSDYAPERGGSIRVVNRGVGFDGLPTKTTGKITAGGTASPGQRKVSFDKMEVGTGKAVMNQPGFEGDYQIYKLGPIVARQYEYAIVGDAVDPEGARGETQLAVIARSPKSFKKYDGEVRDWLMKNGFTSVQEPPRMTGGKSR